MVYLNYTELMTISTDGTTDSQNSTFFSLTMAERGLLIAIYGTVLVTSSIGLTLMICALKSNLRSVTTIAVLNLVLTHLVFLLTVPFRIYYYASGHWRFLPAWCKIVSAMIHIHMNMVFVIYVAILANRFQSFYKKVAPMEFHRRLHALVASVTLWSGMFLIIPLTLYFEYGKHMNNSHGCFNFGMELKHSVALVFNYLMSIVTIGVSCALGGVQCHILYSVRREYGSASTSRQDFWAQIKSLIFVMVMLMCLLPYHFFRLFYLSQPDELENVNEVFLAITALTCLDTFTFLGKGACKICTGYL